MGNRALENRLNRLKALEEQQNALQQQIDSLKDEIKKDMDSI